MAGACRANHKGNGQIVCPGDFIVTTDGRHAVVQQPARAESTSRRQQAQDMKDAARYRWLLEHPTFAVHCFIYLPGHVSAEIDKELAAHEVDG